VCSSDLEHGPAHRGPACLGCDVVRSGPPPESLKESSRYRCALNGSDSPAFFVCAAIDLSMARDAF